MSFSMKPQMPEGGNSNNASDEDWGAWNTYLHELVGDTENPVAGKSGQFVREKTYVGILNFIMDMGFQPQKDGEYDTKCALPEDHQEYSEEELAHLAKYPTNDFIWVDDKGVRKRKQTSPKRPEQEYAFFFDFPEITVDWTKHPIEDLHHLGQKPLRVSYNGKFGKSDALVFGRTLPFNVDYKTNTLSEKNPINKIARAMSLGQEYAQSGYDLGVLAGKACKWTVRSTKRVVNDKTYYNTDIKDSSKIEAVSAGGITITVEQQIPECGVSFVGVPLDDGSYDEDILTYIKNRKELLAVVQRATSFKPSPVKFPDFVLGKDFKDTALCKALNLMEGGEQGDPEPVQQAPVQTPPPAVEPPPFDSGFDGEPVF